MIYKYIHYWCHADTNLPYNRLQGCKPAIYFKYKHIHTVYTFIVSISTPTNEKETLDITASPGVQHRRLLPWATILSTPRILSPEAFRQLKSIFTLARQTYIILCTCTQPWLQPTGVLCRSPRVVLFIRSYFSCCYCGIQQATAYTRVDMFEALDRFSCFSNC